MSWSHLLAVMIALDEDLHFAGPHQKVDLDFMQLLCLRDVMQSGCQVRAKHTGD